MVWRETFPPANELTLDAEAERERRLAAQARAGADWALTALIARYQPAVTRYLTRLCGDQGRARELAERVFQRMERRLHGPHGADNLRLWLLRASTEAGLEALRRPHRPQAPRLGVPPVAGLLPSETGVVAQAVIRGGIRRLRNVVGAVSRQARPLVWQGGESAPSAPSTSSEVSTRTPLDLGPVDESLDTLDPREALRHRLVRLTLADLSYGDAQCLALHLVAGLNQAEVASALGLTKSAARKRIVQGLAQFSTRYQAAVRSLGLPDELGYGDALPRKVEEPAPIYAPPEPAPVIVPETPEESTFDDEIGQAAPATVPLAFETLDDEGEMVSGITYYTRSSVDIPEYSAPVEHDYFPPPEDTGNEDQYPDYQAYPDSGGDEVDTYAAPYDAPPGMDIRMEERESADEEGSENGSPRSGAGGVTRIAADAIVGPVVDALPVHSEPLAMAPGFNAPSSRSVPLVYEISSGDADEATGITMNWIDSSGMLAPLSFEAVITADDADADPVGSDDPWARSVILDLETQTAQESTSAPFEATPDEAPLVADVSPHDDSDSGPPPLDMSIALDEGDYGWERSRQAVSEPINASPGYDLTLLDGRAMEPLEAVGDESSGQMDISGRSAPITRTLEDLWDEAPDLYER